MGAGNRPLTGDKRRIINYCGVALPRIDINSVGDDGSRATALGPSAVLTIPRIVIHSRVARFATHIVPQKICFFRKSIPMDFVKK